jgi:hypothetical protein
MNITRRTRASWPSRYAIGLGLTAAIGLAGSALADPPAAKDGLMTFPNVRVENATPADAKNAKAPTSGMHAYVDPTTGKLRAQTVEEAQQAALEGAPKAKAKVQAKGLKRQATTLSADTTADEGLEVIYGPGNAVGVKLDEEFLSYQVVHKTDTGLQVQEVTGAKAANAAAKAAPVKNSTQEVSHER